MALVDVFLAALAVVAGAVAAVAGFGIGSLLTPALAITTGVRLAVALVAIPHVLATAVRLWTLREAVDGRVLRSFGVASAAGGVAGALLHAVLASPALAMALGALLVVAGLLELTGLGRALRFRGGWAVVAGVASGLFGGLVGNQGGIRSAALLRSGLGPRELVATATASAMFVDLARLPVYLVTEGRAMLERWPSIAILSAGVVAGTLVGAPLLRRLPEAAFRRVLAVLLVVLGVAMLLGLGR